MTGELDVNGLAGGGAEDGEAVGAGPPVGGPVPALVADVVPEDVWVGQEVVGGLDLERALAEPGVGNDLEVFYENFVDVAFHVPIVPLEERKARILGVLDEASITVGLELMAAKEDHKGRFVRWVEEELPFGLDRAERLMQIARAFSDVDPAMKNMLPSAWTALYELTKVPPRALTRAIELGEVSPSMTVADARRYVAEQKGRPTPSAPPPMAEAHAIALMRYHPKELTEDTVWKLIGWLASGSGLVPFPTPSSPSPPPPTAEEDDW